MRDRSEGRVSRTSVWPHLTRGSIDRWVPGYRSLRRYEREWFADDLVAGLILAALLVPQGMAYAQLAGLAPVTGLYTTVAALGAYALFGPSRVLVLGPDSALAPLIAAAVLPLASDPEEAVRLAAMLAVLTGLICVAAGIVRLGAITELLSKPVRVGYLNGLAIVMFVGQLPVLFGFDVDADGTAGEARAFIGGVLDHTSGPTLAVGGGALALMAVLRWRSSRLPAVLIAVVLATAIAALFELDNDGVAVVGTLPQGFPSPGLPSVEVGDLDRLALAAVGIAIVAFADTSALSAGLRARGTGRTTDDPNREAVGLGMANLAAGAFQGFPVSASTTRTVVATAVGSRTQLTGVVGATCVGLVVAFGTALVHDLPIAALAAVIIMAAVSLLDLSTVWWLLKVRRSEAWLSLAATAGVALFGVFEGIAVAVGLSIAAFVYRSWRPHDAVLGRVDAVKGYHDVGRHPEAQRIPGLVLFRFDAPLFFANADHFRRRLAAVVDAGNDDVRWVVLAAEPITDIDTSGAEALAALLDEFDDREIVFAVAELKGRVKDRLRSYGLYERVGDAHIFPTIGTAIDAYLAATGVRWVDWTDRSADTEF